GYLTVERGEGQYYEKGEVIFAQGQVLSAHYAHFHGTEALQRLQAWGACSFVFVYTPAERTTAPLAKVKNTDALKISPYDMQTNPALHTLYPRQSGTDWHMS